MQAIYTTEATAYGPRTGLVTSSDQRLELELSRPASMGGDDGPGTNPEQLFAAGYAACFHSAMRYGVRQLGLPGNSLQGASVTAQVSLLKEEPSTFGLAVTLTGHLPQLDPEQAQALMEATHQVCPYSVATRGNVEVTLTTA
jgi:Ohr subfamily peroxiredoxin